MLTSGMRLKNRIGAYEVISVSDGRAVIRYENGRHSEADCAALEQVANSIAREHAQGTSQVFARQLSHRRHCTDCERPLDRLPELLIEGVQYCYGCAKKAHIRCVGEREIRRDRTRAALATSHASAIQCRDEYLKAAGILSETGTLEASLKVLEFIAWSLPLVSWPIVWPLGARAQRELRRHAQANENFAKEYPTHSEILSKHDELMRNEEELAKPAAVKVELEPSCNDTTYVGSGFDRRAIVGRDGSRCQWCESLRESIELEVHHIIPRAKNGSDCEKNLITLCIPCHMKEDWFGHVHKKAVVRRS